MKRANLNRRRLTLEALEARCLLTGAADSIPAGPAEGEPAAAQVAFRLVATDLAGVPVTRALPGTELFLEVYVRDVRAGVADPGVYAAYLDVDYSDDLLAVLASDTNPLGFEIEFGASYANGGWADASVPGRIDEVGAFQLGSVPLGSGELLLFRARLAAGSMTLQDDAWTGIPEDSADVALDVLANDLFATGTAHFASSPARIRPAHDVITFAPPRVVPTDEIDYGETTVEVSTVGGHPITAVTQPSSGGSVRISSSGEYLLYTPPPDFFGTERFTYTVAGRQTAEVVVQVDPVDDPPRVADHLYRLGRNERLTVAAAHGLLHDAWDVEGDLLAAELVDGPSQGALTLRPDGSFDYLPAADFVGTDRFTYAARDPWLASAQAEVLLEVGGPRVSLRLEVTDVAGGWLGDVVAGEAAFVRVWVRDLRDDYFPERGVFAAYLDMLFDPTALQPMLDDQLPLGFAVGFGPAFAGHGSGAAAQAGAVNSLGAWSSAAGPLGADEQLLLTLPLVALNLRGADDAYRVSGGSSLNLLDVLTNDRTLAWSTRVSAAAADEPPAPDVMFWEPRTAVPPAEMLYGEASIGRANPPGLKVLEVGPASQGGTVTVAPDGGCVAYTPAAGFAGTETFRYVLVDPQGRTATAEVAVEVVPSWQNLRRPLDVNGDGLVSSIDALLIINHLNAGYPSRLEGSPTGPPFRDVNGDGYVAPIDALLVINYLNRLGRGDGAGAAAGEASRGSVAASLAVDAAAEGDVAAAGSWLAADVPTATRAVASPVALPVPWRADAAHPWPTPRWLGRRPHGPSSLAGRSSRRGRHDLVPQGDLLALEELCELFGAWRDGEPQGG